MTKPPIIVDEWENCYPSQWKGLIVPDAIRHPAKFSSKLIRRIYDHMTEEGWLKPGDSVVDPFGGVALGALDAMRLGLNWVGVELEPRFVDLGQGYDCPGFTEDQWVRYHHRGERVNYRHGFHWCPECARMTVKKQGCIPFQDPHRYHGNIDFWQQKYSWMPGDAVLLQGDSRFLADVLARADGALTSPPHGPDALGHGGKSIAFDKLRGEKALPDVKYNAVSSPPFQESIGPGLNDQRTRKSNSPKDHGGPGPSYDLPQSSGQLGAMKATQAGFEAALTSPVYGETIKTGEGPGARHDFKTHSKENAVKVTADRKYGETPGQLGEMPAGDFNAAITSPPFKQASGGTGATDYLEEKYPGVTARHAAGNAAAKAYGAADGQLANLPEGDFDAALSSPPFEKSEGAQSAHKFKDPEAFARTRHNNYQSGRTKGHTASAEAILRSLEKAEDEVYGETAGNIGNDAGDDFWSAARLIVEQVYKVLAPGGHAAWVVKGFVKNKELMDFPDQWRQLCEAVGFITIHEHRALLVRNKGTSITLEGAHIHHEVQSKSFFRRLAENKGSPRIDWETVYCMVKPEKETL